MTSQDAITIGQMLNSKSKDTSIQIKKATKSSDVWRIARPFWILFAIIFTSLSLFSIIITYGQNQNAVESSKSLFKTVFESKLTRLSELALEYAYWDEAVENLVFSYDAEWVASNFSDYIHETLKVTRGLVIDPADAVVLDVVEGVLLDITAPVRPDIDVLPLVRQARAGERDVEPEPVYGVVRQGAIFYLASAVRMTTYTTLNGTEVDQSTDHVMVFLQTLDPDLLGAISSGYLLPDLRIADDPGGTWAAALPIEAIGATEPVYFVWEPVLPGNEMLPRLLLGLFGIFALMLLSVWAFVRRADAAGREMEAARRQAELANQAKTDFLRVVTHEVRTPVNAIVGFAGIMKREMFGPIQNEKYAEYVDDISKAGDHVLTLVSDLLDLEKIEQGRMTFDIESVEASTLARDASALVMELASGKGIKVDIEVDENLPALQTDARAVRQILINLLGNAIKFTPPGGRVRCRAFAPGRGGVVLQVADTGPGIPKDQIERVLSPFGQLVTDYAEGQRGSGLGLPIAKRMTEALGGTFAFESEVGRGTTATIRFGGGVNG